MSHNLGLFMLTPRFCLQPEKLKINFQFTMNSQETIVSVFQEKFSINDWGLAYRVYKDLSSRVLNLYKKKNCVHLSNYIIQDVIA